MIRGKFEVFGMKNIKKSFFYILFVTFSFSRAVLQHEQYEKEEDFSGKKIVGYFTKKTEGLKDDEQDLYDIRERLLTYKKEILTFDEKALTENEEVQKFLKDHKLTQDQIKNTLLEPRAPSSQTLWNNFQGRFRGNHLYNENLSILYRNLNPSRKIILDGNNKLVRVRFSNCQMTDEVFLRINSTLSHLTAIEELDISENNLTMESLPILLRIVRNENFKCLKLTGNEIDESECLTYLRDHLYVEGAEKIKIMCKFQFGKRQEEEFSIVEKLRALSLAE
jgi:hypothetical protein